MYLLSFLVGWCFFFFFWWMYELFGFFFSKRVSEKVFLSLWKTVYLLEPNKTKIFRWPQFPSFWISSSLQRSPKNSSKLIRIKPLISLWQFLKRAPKYKKYSFMEFLMLQDHSSKQIWLGLFSGHPLSRRGRFFSWKSYLLLLWLQGVKKGTC